ncbi:cupin domain-containing protein [Emticicia sp. TH156]|uniref:cupin domain-containing protein n=1 Tax=Emticicia sp. TH156 TaxID=2067454 RepID=UPI000C757F10|nr:cupin domain-containing protein [Emticicia sp. TH156]PLK44384.1 cupin [Emticicia sp. TH156]
MQRRNFIRTSLASMPLMAVPSTIKDRAAKSFTVQAGKDRFNQPTPFKGVNPNDVKISAKDTDGELSVFEYTGYQKTGPSLHVHLYQDETFYVIEGEYLFQVGDERSTLKAGDTIFLPRNIPHTWLQLTDKGKMIYFLNPAGKLEEFFKKVSAAQGPPTREAIDKLHHEHGMKVLGPPISL